MQKGNIKHHIRSLTLLLSTNWESHKETPLKGISWLPGLAEMISAAFIWCCAFVAIYDNVSAPMLIFNNDLMTNPAFSVLC